jgi:hypothetical protein
MSDQDLYDDHLKDEYKAKPKRKHKNDSRMRRILLIVIGTLLIAGAFTLAALTLIGPRVGDVYSNIILDLKMAGTTYPAEFAANTPQGEVIAQGNDFSYLQIDGSNAVVRSMMYDDIAQQIELLSERNINTANYHYVTLARGGRYLLTQSFTGDVELYEREDKSSVRIAQGLLAGLPDISLFNVAALSASDEVTLYDLKGNPLGFGQELQGTASRLVLNREGTLLAAIYTTEVELFEHYYGVLRKTRQMAFDKPIIDAVFTPDNELVVVNAPDVIHILDTGTGTRRYEIPSGYGQALNVAASDDWLVVVLTDAAAAWRLDDSTLEPEDNANSPVLLKAAGPTMPFAAGLLDHNRAVVVYGSGDVLIFDLMTGQVVAAYS